jgi:hypothetical protein
VEADRKKTLKLSNIKYLKLAVHCFAEKVINKNETVTMFLKIHTYHSNQIKKIVKSRIRKIIL